MSEPPLVDITGRMRSPAATPGHWAGCAPPNKGQRYPADPPTVEEIILVMRQAGPGRYADRTRALIAILWRAGLRISEALALAETDLDPKTGSVLVRVGKGGKRRTVGMDDWAWEHVARDRPGGGRGQRQPPAANYADSRTGPGCGGGSRRTSSGMRTRSRWPTKGFRCRSSSASSGMPTSGSPRFICKASIPARSSTPSITAGRP
jgi:integrase